ncbi:hypothetical protein ACFPRL_27050 [Pseudoclavibacter helvolus]
MIFTSPSNVDKPVKTTLPITSNAPSMRTEPMNFDGPFTSTGPSMSSDPTNRESPLNVDVPSTLSVPPMLSSPSMLSVPVTQPMPSRYQLPVMRSTPLTIAEPSTIRPSAERISTAPRSTEEFGRGDASCTRLIAAQILAISESNSIRVMKLKAPPASS